MTTPSRSTQKLTVALAFLVATASLLTVAIGWVRRGEIALTPLVGGLLMLALGAGGLRRIRHPPA
jgi:hypothetical protein